MRAAEYIRKKSLIINFYGTNTITGGTAYKGSNGIFFNGTVTFNGADEGILNVNGGYVKNNSSIGICADNVVINSGTVNACGGLSANNVSAGICANAISGDFNGIALTGFISGETPSEPVNYTAYGNAKLTADFTPGDFGDYAMRCYHG